MKVSRQIRALQGTIQNIAIYLLIGKKRHVNTTAVIERTARLVKRYQGKIASQSSVQSQYFTQNTQKLNRTWQACRCQSIPSSVPGTKALHSEEKGLQAAGSSGLGSAGILVLK